MRLMFHYRVSERKGYCAFFFVGNCRAPLLYIIEQGKKSFFRHIGEDCGKSGTLNSKQLKRIMFIAGLGGQYIPHRCLYNLRKLFYV